MCLRFAFVHSLEFRTDSTLCASQVSDGRKRIRELQKKNAMGVGTQVVKVVPLPRFAASVAKRRPDFFGRRKIRLMAFCQYICMIRIDPVPVACGELDRFGLGKNVRALW